MWIEIKSSIFFSCALTIVIPLGTVIYRVWKKRRCRSKCDYCRLLKCYMVNGWRLAVSHKSFGLEKAIGYAIKGQLSDYLASINHGYVYPASYPMPDNEELRMRRISQISPRICATLHRIMYRKNKWEFRCCQFVSDRTVVTIFRRLDDNGTATSSHRPIWGDAFTRQQPMDLPVQAPSPKSVFWWLYVHEPPKQRVDVFFAGPYTPYSFVLHVVSYDSENPEGRYKPSWKAIMVPWGCNNMARHYVWDSETLLVVFMNTANPTAIENWRCLTYSNSMGWRIDTFADWMASTQTTAFGSRLSDTYASLDSLKIEMNPLWGVEELKYKTRIGLQMNGTIDFDSHFGILSRWIQPPSLALMAAQALLRAKPDLDRKELEAAIGFDVFEDIPDDAGEDSAPIVTL